MSIALIHRPADCLAPRPVARRLWRGSAALVFALGLSFGAFAAGSLEAQAVPSARLSSPCFHNGKQVNHGHVIEIGGIPYVCVDGRWVLSPFFAPVFFPGY